MSQKNYAVQNHIENTLDREKANKLCNEIKELRSNIWLMEEKIRSTKEEISAKEKILWNTCEHEWKRDYTVAFDDHVKHCCQKCSLWRNHYMYQ